MTRKAVIYMITMLAGKSGMQNVYAPLPFVAHLVFCALATLLYAVLFNRRGKRHYLVLMIAIDLTLMTQFWTDELVIFAVGFAEVVMLIIAGVLAYKSAQEDKELAEKRKQEARIRRMEREERLRSEKLFVKQEYIDKNFGKGIVDHAFDEDDDE